MINYKNLLPVIIVVFLLLASGSSAEIDFGGYYKNTFLYLSPKRGDGILADVNKLRLRFEADILSNVFVHLEPDYAFLIKPKDIPLIEVSELDKVVLDRAWVKVIFPQADLIVGKQRIAWGTGYLWNPTDVFNPFALAFAVAEEERRGIDAMRIQIPLGIASGVEGVVLTDKEWNALEKSKKGIKARTNIGMYDLSLSYVALGDEGFQFGFDTAGELFGLGVRSEIAWVNTAEASDYFKAIFGWNYTFENGLGIDMEYFYNGLGKKNKADYDWSGFFAGDIYQLGMDYIYFGLNYMIDEITDIRLSFLVNADDSSFMVYPSYSRNIFENVDLSLEALLVGGEEGGEFNPSSAEDASGFLGSNMLFLKVRYSF